METKIYTVEFTQNEMEIILDGCYVRQDIMDDIKRQIDESDKEIIFKYMEKSSEINALVGKIKRILREGGEIR